MIFGKIKIRSEKIKREDWKFLLSSLLVTIFLAFIIEIKPHHMLRSQLNISNLIIYLFYFVVVGSYFLKYMKLLSHYKYVLIITSYMFLGLASTVDLLSDGQLIKFSYNEIVEDIFHILGIVFWLLFFVDYSSLLKRNTKND